MFMIRQGRALGFGAVLSNGIYVKLWLAQGASSLGDALARIGLLVAVTMVSNSPLLLTAVVLAQAIPAIILGPVAGVFVDRWHKKRVMVLADLLRTGFFAVAAFRPEPVILIAVAFCSTAASVFFSPARVSVVPKIVGEEEYITAVGLERTTVQAMGLVGPPIGGALVALLGPGIAFAINAATFLFSGLMVLLAAVPEVAQAVDKAPGWFRREFHEGLRVITNSEILRYLLTLFSVVLVFAGGLSVLFVDYLRNHLGVSPAQLGIAEGVLAAGLLISAGLIGYFGKGIPRGRLIVGAIFLIGLVSVTCFGQPNYLWFILWLFALGLCDGLSEIPINAVLVEAAPEDKRGRVTTVYGSLMRVAAIIGAGIAGPLALAIGSHNVIGISGVLITIVAGVAFLRPQYQMLNDWRPGQAGEGDQKGPAGSGKGVAL